VAIKKKYKEREREEDGITEERRGDRTDPSIHNQNSSITPQCFYHDTKNKLKKKKVTLRFVVHINVRCPSISLGTYAS
jgi:hypothetical protein